jgi:hypothetical protein
MRARFHSRLIGALLVPTLVVSGAAQGMLLMRCGPATRMSCCCPKEQTPPPVSTVKPEKMQCCDTAAIPAAPAQVAHEKAAPTIHPPMLVAILGAAPALEVSFDRARHVPHLDPSPARSLVLTNCALLI